MTVNIAWDHLTFLLTPTKTMFIARFSKEKAWYSEEYLPFGDFQISPAATVLNYGQGLFEGLKAQRTEQGAIKLFRPHENAKRMSSGATRFCMPAYPTDKFVNAVKNVVQENAEYVPPYRQGALYIRPCLWGVTAALGVKEAEDYMFVIYVSPVGPYYKGGVQPVDVVVSEDYVRAAPLGCGDVKCLGNYAGVLIARTETKKQGYADCIFLDAVHRNYIEEASSSNFFAVIKGELVTPKLGSILPGITRDSILHLAREKLKMPVCEREITVAEAKNATEIFLTGTAAVVSPVGSLTYRGDKIIYSNYDVGPVTFQLYQLLTGMQTGEIADEYNWIMDLEG